MNKLKEVPSELWKKCKQRYIFLILFTLILMFFGYCYKGNLTRNFSDINNEEKEVLLFNNLEQSINIGYDDLIHIFFKVGKNDSGISTKYKVSILKDNEELCSTELDAASLEKEQYCGMILPYKSNGGAYTIRITSDNLKSENAMKLITYETKNNSINVDGKTLNKSLSVKAEFSRFSKIYLMCLFLVYLCGIVSILYINVRNIHNTVFAIVIVTGILSAVINPVLDIPDEHAHICRAELTSRGKLFIDGNISDYNISQSIGNLIENNFTTIDNDDLFKSSGSADYTASYGNLAASNLFIPYIPQTIGIWFAKLFGMKDIFILIFGRIFNLLSYALMVRYAIKIAPSFKIPLAVIAIMPIQLFIAASFNPDATTYGLTFLLVGYFLKIYKEGNISKKEMGIFTIISVLLGLVKLPYCLLGGLLVFMPKDKFVDKKMYYMRYIFVAIVAMIALGWGLYSMFRPGESPFEEFFTSSGVSTSEQIKYILSNPIEFIGNFTKNLFDNFSGYVNQLNCFGWLNYHMNDSLMLIYNIFLGSVLILYPNKDKIAVKTKVGSFIVIIGVYVITNLILYLTWNAVGSKELVGVQGRYFSCLLCLVPMLSTRQTDENNIEKRDFINIFIAVIFAMLYLVTVLYSKY